MNDLSYLKQEHKEIFGSVLEIEKLMRKKSESLEMAFIFKSFINLILQHEQNEKFVFRKIKRYYNIRFPPERATLDPRRINGHIKVINNAIESKDINKISLALKNDGRMLLSKIKEQVFKEEVILDSILIFYLKAHRQESQILA